MFVLTVMIHSWKTRHIQQFKLTYALLLFKWPATDKIVLPVWLFIYFDEVEIKVQENLNQYMGSEWWPMSNNVFKRLKGSYNHINLIITPPYKYRNYPTGYRKQLRTPEPCNNMIQSYLIVKAFTKYLKLKELHLVGEALLCAINKKQKSYVKKKKKKKQ